MQLEIDNMNSKHLTVIDEQEGVIKHTITEIELIILRHQWYLPCLWVHI